jgi:hypothetical protein
MVHGLFHVVEASHDPFWTIIIYCPQNVVPWEEIVLILHHEREQHHRRHVVLLCQQTCGCPQRTLVSRTQTSSVAFDYYGPTSSSSS